MEQINLLEVFRTLLNIEGKYKKLDPDDHITVYRQFSDEKVLIIATLEQENKTSRIRWTYAKIYVFLKGGNSSFKEMKPWGLPIDLSQYTPVYLGEVRDESITNIFYRAGRWQIYLRNLSNRINREFDYIGRFNGHPVDDEDIFGGRY